MSNEQNTETNAANANKLVVLQKIEDYYGETREIAEVIYEILVEQHDADFDDIIETAEQEARDEAEAAIGEPLTTEELDQKLAEKVDEALDLYLMDFDLETGRGPNNGAYTLEGDGREWLFGTNDTMEEEAVERVKGYVDEGIIDMDTIKDSWARGETMDDWAKGVVRIDGVGHVLNSYDGEEYDVNTSGGWYTYVRWS